MTDGPIRVFDRALVRRRRARAAPGFAAHDFLVREVAGRLAERLQLVRRPLPRALVLGAPAASAIGQHAGADLLVAADPAPEMLAGGAGLRLAVDEEALPVADAAFDLVASCLTLHWVNDLPGALVQIRRALRPDGLFLAAMLGGSTLVELRRALTEADVEASAGAHPRVSPFADVRDAGALLQRAGFALPVVDRDLITVTYADALALMRDLRGMGEASSLAARRGTFTPRTVLARAAALYAEHHAGPDGRIPATFEVITLTGWAPHAAQPQPLRPGSGRTSLATALGEGPAG